MRGVSRRELLGLLCSAPLVGMLGCDRETSFPDLKGSFPAMAAAQQIGAWVLAEHGSRSKRELWEAAFGVGSAAGLVDAGASQLRDIFRQGVRHDFEKERKMHVK